MINLRKIKIKIRKDIEYTLNTFTTIKNYIYIYKYTISLAPSPFLFMFIVDAKYLDDTFL